MPRATILRSNVKGWGADLDPHNRPGVPKEMNDESVTDVRGVGEYEKIPQQIPRIEILRSFDHAKLTPIFGTTCPPKGLSGMFRRLAFRFSEGRKAHWLILLFADRVDVAESGIYNLLRRQSHNPVQEYGIGVELRKGGFLSRFGHNRGDTKRFGQEAILVFSVIGVSLLLFRSQRQ